MNKHRFLQRRYKKVIFAGQLGDGMQTKSENPVRIMEHVSQISAGLVHSMAVTEDGSLYVWGSNQEGQLGVGDNTDSLKPISGEHPEVLVALTPVKIMDGVRMAEACSVQSMAVTSDGILYTWGREQYRWRLRTSRKPDDASGACHSDCLRPGSWPGTD